MEGAEGGPFVWAMQTASDCAYASASRLGSDNLANFGCASETPHATCVTRTKSAPQFVVDEHGPPSGMRAWWVQKGFVFSICQNGCALVVLQAEHPRL